MQAMNADQLIEALKAANAVGDAYIAASPQWVQIWVMVMGLTMMSSFLLAPFKREARWVALSMVYTILGSVVLIALAGPSQLWGVVHLVFWPIPLAVIIPKLIREPIQGWYNRYLAAILLVMTVSLAFDAWDVYRFFTAG